jgi:hypothetical protein
MRMFLIDTEDAENTERNEPQRHKDTENLCRAARRERPRT